MNTLLLLLTLLIALSAPAQQPTLPVFDVVSLRPTTIPSDQTAIDSPPGGNGIAIHNMTVQAMVLYAYDFRRPELVSGLPEWAKTQTYDLTAKVADADLPAFRKLDQAQRKQMVQAVLAERLQFKAHREPKELLVYALVIAKTGIKMKLATPGDKYAGGSKSSDGTAAGPGTLIPTAKGLTAQAIPIETLALMLSRLDLGREVVDRTGLTGRYDFTLRCAPTYAMRPIINGQMQPLSADEEALPSIFTALPEQLGLKLEPAKAPIQALIIDQIKPPSKD